MCYGVEAEWKCSFLDCQIIQMQILYTQLIQLFHNQHSVQRKMYPFWNPYCSPYMMHMPSFLPFFQPLMYVNPSPLVIPNQIIPNDRVSMPEITKNTQKNTEQPSKSIIDISSDSQSSIQQIQASSFLEKKQLTTKKTKPDRFLGFKEGIFQKENNDSVKPTRSLRKRSVLTRARIKKYKEKNGQEKTKQRRKTIQKSVTPKKLRLSPRISKKENRVKNKVMDKKPRSRQFGKLRKYLRGVAKTVDLPEMYTLKSGFLKMLQEKRENLLMRQTD